MSRQQQATHWAIIAALGIAFSSLHSPLATADDTATATLVEQALACEAAGPFDERRRLLDEVLSSDPASALARWASGYVQVDGAWLPFEQATQHDGRAAVLNEYFDRRESAPPTYKGHLELAHWCRRSGLPEKEEAHLIAAVELAGASADAAHLARIGLQQSGGEWVSRDRRNAARVAREQQLAFDEWLPRLQRIARGLDSVSRDMREKRLAEWRAIEDPAALPAMEAVFSHQDLPIVHTLIEVYSGMQTHHAAVALARQAVLSPYATVREAAATALRKRSPDAYAPVLLDTLETPIDSRVHLYIANNGVRITKALYRENQDFSQLAMLHGERRFIPNYIRIPGVGRGARARNKERFELAAAATLRDAALTARAIDHEVELQNVSTEDWNTRILQTLSTATGLNLPDTPQPWWQWWLDYNELYSTGEKPCQYTYSFDSSTERIPLEMPMSCLAAGTLVWTDRGAIPVETVQIGDLALSRHPETAELAYKPVLRTTVRPATELHKVTVGGDSFLATGGHTFWISGRGWTKVRDLEPGLRFHGATEPSAIESIEPGGSEPTYNLIVADFHTYFVGPRLVLSHDPTFAQPTDVKVPGLAAR